jgi:hypothetical protein
MRNVHRSGGNLNLGCEARSPRWRPSGYVRVQAKAEDDLTIALLQTQRVIDDYYSMAPSDGDFALDKALKLQHQAMDEYVAVCGRFRKFIIEGTLLDESVNPSHQPRVANCERGAS